MQLDFFSGDPEPKRREKTADPPAERSAPPVIAEVPVIEPVVRESPEPRVFSIAELNRSVRALLEGEFGEVWVRGEISNYRSQSSGHHYFNLKDATSQIACVLFAGNARRIRGLRLADGAEVRAFGRISVYEARGQYQLVIESLEMAGAGALHAKFEALKARLAAEGLFDPDKKRPLPRFPRAVGVVTSPTGAAIRDFLHVLHRRMAGIRVVIYPVRVQGRGAAAEIAGGVRFFSSGEAPKVDLVVVTRGGGSVEDLWEFNEEVVARAVRESSLPVVSAVGHEIDFTISDFAADLRAPTPSAAAELIAADAGALLHAVVTLRARLDQNVQSRLRLFGSTVAGLARAPWSREPMRRIQQAAQRVDDLGTRLVATPHDQLAAAARTLEHAARVLAIHRPDALMANGIARMKELETRAARALTTRLREKSLAVARCAGMLGALSPNATLARGFTITTDAAGNILRSCESLRTGVPIRTRFADGEVSSSVRAVTRVSPPPESSE